MNDLNLCQPEQDYSSTANKFQYPILWVSNWMDAASTDLGNLFEVRSFKDINDYTATDAQHYIIDTGASEEIIKAIAWTVGECSIWHCESKLPLSYLAPDHATSIEVFDDIFSRSQPIEDWLKETNQESNKLSYFDAIQQAELAIRLLNGSKKVIELDILRRRCSKPGESSFDWNRAMKELEREFEKELERRRVANKQQTKKDRLRFELLALSEVYDPIDLDDALSDIAQRYGKSISKLEVMLSQIIDSMSEAQPRRLTSAEFHALETPDVAWLIPGLIPATGVTLVAANPSVGKTTLCYDLGASVIYNEEFLGEMPVKTGKVIFVNSPGEMPDSEMQRSFVDRRIGVSDKYETLLDWNMKQLPRLEKMIEELQPILLVIDSYRGMTGFLPGFDENSAKAGIPIRRLQALCNRYNTAMVVIHHNNKTLDYGLIGKSAGNFSIAGTSNTVLQLDKDDATQEIKLTTAKIRGSEHRELKIKLDRFERHFEVISDSAKQNEPEIKGIAPKIINLLNSNPGIPVPLKDIPKLIGEQYDSVRRTISRLDKEGQIIKFLGGKDNREKLIKKKLTPPPTYFLNNNTSTPKNFDTQGFQNTGQDTGQYTQDSGRNQTIQDCPQPCPLSETLSMQASKADSGQMDNDDRGGGTKKSSLNSIELVSNNNNQVNTRSNSSEPLEPNQTNVAVDKPIVVEFNAEANAELMIGCIEDDNATDMLRELTKCWTLSQMAEVRNVVHKKGKLDEIRNLMKQTSEAPISDKAPRTTPHADNGTGEASKQVSDKTPKPKSINVGSPVKYKNSEDNKVYKVVGGNGKKWQLERLDKPAKSQKDIISDVPTNQLELVADGS